MAKHGIEERIKTIVRGLDKVSRCEEPEGTHRTEEFIFLLRSSLG